MPSPASSRTRRSTTSRRPGGDPGAPLGDPQDPGRRRRAAAARSLRRDSHLVQRCRGDRCRSALVGSGRCGRARRDRQRLDPPRPRSAAGQDRRLRAVRPRRRRPAGLDEARAARPTIRRRPRAVGAPLDRSRRERSRQQCGLLAGGRGLGARAGIDAASPHRAELDYRDPIDLDDRVELATFTAGDESRCVAFLAGDRVRAVAAVRPLGA